MSKSIKGQGGHLGFSDRPEKNTNLVEDFEIIITSYQVLFNFVQRLQRRSRNCLSQSEVGRPSLFSDRPEKHKPGRGPALLMSCFLSNFVEFSCRRKSMPNDHGGLLVLRSARKTQTW